jgi:hypothetical protein
MAFRRRRHDDHARPAVRRPPRRPSAGSWCRPRASRVRVQPVPLKRGLEVARRRRGQNRNKATASGQRLVNRWGYPAARRSTPRAPESATHPRSGCGLLGGAGRREAGRPLVDHSLGRQQPRSDRTGPRARRGRPRSAPDLCRRDDQAGVDREETDPEQPRNYGSFDDESLRQLPSAVGNPDQIRRPPLGGARCTPRVASTPSRPP